MLCWNCASSINHKAKAIGNETFRFQQNTHSVRMGLLVSPLKVIVNVKKWQHTIIYTSIHQHMIEHKMCKNDFFSIWRIDPNVKFFFFKSGWLTDRNWSFYFLKKIILWAKLMSFLHTLVSKFNCCFFNLKVAYSFFLSTKVSCFTCDGRKKKW